MTLSNSANSISTTAHLSVGSSILERHITASGNISASLDIFGRGLRLYGPDSIISNGDSIFGNNASLDTHKFSGSVNIVGDVTASGNISSSGYIVADYYVTNISEPVVAGVNLATATPIDPSAGIVISEGDDSVKGLRLPVGASIPKGTTYRIINKSAARAIKVYPADGGEQIFPLTAGTSASIGNLESMTLTSNGGEVWYGSKGTAITG